jgi:hypothetical protein
MDFPKFEILTLNKLCRENSPGVEVCRHSDVLPQVGQVSIDHWLWWSYPGESSELFAIQLTNALGLFTELYIWFLFRYDFFIISQSVRQGTVSPTHYNVIHDGTGIKPDHIQRLTYKLTHLYYNWPVSIRVNGMVHFSFSVIRLFIINIY